MSVSVDSLRRYVEALNSGCERLINPRVADAGERGRQCRLLALLFIAPFVIAIALAQTLTTSLDLAGAFAGVLAVLGASSALAVLVISSGRRRLAEFAALASAVMVHAFVLRLSGGAASPLLLLGIAIPLETHYVSRSPRASVLAGLAAVAVLAVFQLPGGAGGPAPSAWYWLAPAVYVALLGIRAVLLMERPSRAASAEAADRSVLAELGIATLTVAPNGDVEDASVACRRLTGIDGMHLAGQGLFGRIHVADRVGYLCALDGAREGRATHRLDIRLRVPDIDAGQPHTTFRPFRLDVLPQPSGDGGVLVLMGDGTELATLRDALAHGLERAGQLEVAKGRFLAAVSHELRTPLNAIIGFSEMLLEPQISGKLSGRQEEQVGLIREAGGHLLSVVNAILDVSKIESGTYRIAVEPFRPEAALTLCRQMLEPQAAEKGVALHVREAAPVGELNADQRAVQQMLINLVSNAIKFTPQGGSVTMVAAARGDRVVLRVSDDGIGIAEEDLKNVGRPFVQVQNDYTRQYQGTGLGLSLVKGLVELHRGSMEIESAPGLGTTVTIELPRMGPGTATGEVLALTPAEQDTTQDMETAQDGATFLKSA